MSSKNKSNARQQQEQFTEHCCYLGLKLLAEEYQQMVDRANEGSLGYYEFIRDIVQAEAAAKRQRRIESLIKSSRLRKKNLCFRTVVSPKRAKRTLKTQINIT